MKRNLGKGELLRNMYEGRKERNNVCNVAVWRLKALREGTEKGMFDI